MKRKYIKPTTEVLASIEEPMMLCVSGGIDNSGQSVQSVDGGTARGTDFMEDESEDNAMGYLWEE